MRFCRVVCLRSFCFCYQCVGEGFFFRLRSSWLRHAYMYTVYNINILRIVVETGREKRETHSQEVCGGNFSVQKKITSLPSPILPLKFHRSLNPVSILYTHKLWSPHTHNICTCIGHYSTYIFCLLPFPSFFVG